MFFHRKLYFAEFVALMLLLAGCGGTSHVSSNSSQVPAYEIEQVRVAQNGSRFVKVWAVAGNADKAIDEAMSSAVEACLFKGIEANGAAGYVPPLCPDGIEAYKANKAYFDHFFKGDHLLYVTRANSKYPTGEDNISYHGMRRVGVYVQLKVSDLRRRMEKDGIIKSLDNIWEIK